MSGWRWVLAILGALLLLRVVVGLACSGSGSEPMPNESAATGPVVERVIDGDTVVLADGERVRYLGVDTPEMRPSPECGAQAATNFNRRLVEGRRVELRSGPDDRGYFGRLLRYVFVDGVHVNAELVRLGYARPATYDPDEPFSEELEELGRQAQREGAGSWSACGW